MTTPASSSSWVYGYDDANEQTSATMNGGTPETRSYDAWGRMATRTQGRIAKAGTDPSPLRCAWVSPRFCYGGRQYSYTTNFAGEAAETLQYRGDGRLQSRVSGTSTKVYRYDRGWNAINEEDGAGNLTTTSVYAPGAEVGERLAYVYGTLSTGFPFYAYHDQLGSTRRWRNASKTLLGSNDFGPYGEPYASYTSAPIDYALHVQDPYTLLYHAAYREYSAGWGRWTTRDPLGMVDGPNEYAYVGDGPINGVDPLGEESWECTQGYINCLRSRPDGENKQNCKDCAKACVRMDGKWPTASKKCGPGPNPQIPTTGQPCPKDKYNPDPSCTIQCAGIRKWYMRYLCLIACLTGTYGPGPG